MAIIISFAFVETRCRSTEERDGENGRVLIAATMGGFPPFSSSSSSFLTSIVVVTLCLIREKTGFSLDRSFVEKFFFRNDGYFFSGRDIRGQASFKKFNRVEMANILREVIKRGLRSLFAYPLHRNSKRRRC